ncbi:hypothetical protein [Hyperthermus butylicus]|nr:hypothetical protein [Hyperthermus butylicus]
MTFTLIEGEARATVKIYRSEYITLVLVFEDGSEKPLYLPVTSMD